MVKKSEATAMSGEGGILNGGPQEKRGRAPFAMAKRRLFLEALAETCCVRTAIAAADASCSNVYALRRRDAEFATQWLEALTLGYDTVEAKLLRYVTDDSAGDIGGNAAADRGSDANPEADGITPPASRGKGVNDPRSRSAAIRGRGVASGLATTATPVPAWVQVALLLLNRHRATVGGSEIGIKSRKTATAEETDAVLNRRLDQLARSIRKASVRKVQSGE
jgi:hypothetical protein